MVEHRLAKARVASSNLVSRSKIHKIACPSRSGENVKTSGKREISMRNPFFRRLSMLLICGAVAITAMTPAALAKPHKSTARAKMISGSGCVSAGVEAGCLILTNSKGVTYSLHFRGRKPKVGTAIRFSGTQLDVDTCQQGTPVSVRTWITLKMKCPPTKQQ